MSETLSGTFFCNKCGTLNTVGAQFCSQCGAPTNPAAGAAPMPGATNPPPPANPYPPVAAYPGAMPYPAAAPLGGVRYGGFWIRFVAVIIDGIIVQVVVMPLSFVVGGVTGAAGVMGGIPRAGLPLLGGLLGAVIGVFGGWLYEALMESSSRQATVGKMIFGMKVTDLSGNRISFGRATGRHFGKWISAMILCIGFIMVGLTERKQGLHDMLAGTLVRIG
jgi:uncharacterized RDD family membrane protein YckC